MILQVIFQKKYIILTYIIFHIQYASAYEYKQSQNHSYLPSTCSINNDTQTKNSSTTIYAESDTVKIHYPKKIQLFGNVRVKNHNNIITSDMLTILNTNNNNSFNAILYANGNVRYYNNNITLTGSRAQWNLHDTKLDLYQGTYYLNKFHIYGTAAHIMQRSNNHCTIIKKSNIIGCKFNNNSWNIIGSDVLYDQNKNYIHIWNAYLKIKTIPIFYSPYLSFSPNQIKSLELYIPTITYNNKYGLTIKFPFPLIYSKYYSGHIAPYYASNLGFGLQTKIHYLTTPKTGLLSLNSIKNYTNNCNYNNKIFYKLSWKHHSIINKKWHLNIDYIKHNKSINYNSDNLNKKYFHNIHSHYIDQKFLFYYNNEHWKASIIYLNQSNIHKKKHIIQNYYTYSVAPQLEIRFYSSPIYKKNLYFQTLGQISQFIPSNYIYPKTTRIHIEPNINFTTNNYWIKFNINAKLYMTHYKQKNIDFYNTKQHKQFYLKNKINRIVPQIKTNSTMIFQKKTNVTQSYKYFLESKLQYLYIPNVFQENIGIYDSKKIYINYNNLFYGMQYSGLDRIRAANQFIGSITMRYFNKQTKLLYLSLGQTLNLKQNNNFIQQINDTKLHTHNSIMHPNTNKLLSLAKGSWNINDYWNIYIEMQCDTCSHKLYSKHAILEYIGKNKQIFQFNYRYVNSQCLQNTLLPSNKSIYYKPISQIGFIAYYPISNNWILNYSHYHNNKSNSLITQSAGIQYSTPCYMLSIMLERSIINWNNKLNLNAYENKIQLNFKLIHSKSNFQPNSYKFFNHNMIPYQSIR